MEKFGERICDDPIVDSGGEKLFLRIAWKLRPHFQRGVTEQQGDLVIVHLKSFRRAASFVVGLFRA